MGDEGVVGAVRIQNGQALGAVPLGSALRDLGDAAVEAGASARQARIDGVGALMRGPPPVAGRDDIALPRQFLLPRPVVEIAADGSGRFSPRGAHATLPQRLLGRRTRVVKEKSVLVLLGL